MLRILKLQKLKTDEERMQALYTIPDPYWWIVDDWANETDNPEVKHKFLQVSQSMYHRAFN